MHIILPSHAIYLFISATLTLIAAGIAWRHRVQGSFALRFLLLAMSIWSGFYALQMLPFPSSTKILLSNITYVGVVAVPALFLAFALSFTSQKNIARPRSMILLAVEPVITLLLVWTNNRHNLFSETFTFIEKEGLTWLEPGRGLWYTVNMFYSYALILVGLVVLLYGMMRAGPLLKNQYRIILLAALVPWGMSIYYEYSLKGHQVDFAPIAFGISGILFTYSVIHNHLLDIIPVARSRLIESMRDGILVLDEQDRIVDLNPAMAGFLSQPPARLVGKPASQILAAWVEDTNAVFAGRETRLALRIPIIPPRYLDMHVTPLFDSYQRLNGRLMVFHDITDHKHVERQLRYANKRQQAQLIEIGTLQSKLRSQAIHDPLTDLFNRRYLDETLDRELARASREGYPLCIIMMDIDHFKRLNDTHGHEAGDLVLKALAGVLLTRNRRGDFACRFGGEEFVVVMPNIALESACKRAEQLRAELNSITVPHGDAGLSITISMGIACYPANGLDRESLLRAADRAMYAAKRAGRDYILTYDHLEAQNELLSN